MALLATVLTYSVPGGSWLDGWAHEERMQRCAVHGFHFQLGTLNPEPEEMAG